jgi:hypothetical protein
MTPLEKELLETAWPYVWTGMLAVAGWFLRSQAKRLETICDSLREFSKDVARIEKEMAEDRAGNRHRIDRLIGESDARIGRIEAVCETQHGIALNRRSTDTRPISWAHESDISGDKNR